MPDASRLSGAGGSSEWKRYIFSFSGCTTSLVRAAARGHPAEKDGGRAAQQKQPLGAIPDRGAQEESAALATCARHEDAVSRRYANKLEFCEGGGVFSDIDRSDRPARRAEAQASCACDA